MKYRGLVVLAVAAVIGLIAAFLVYSVVLDRDRPVLEAQNTTTTTVVVARSRLDFGANIERAHLSEATWPADSVPPGTYRTIDEILKPGESRAVIRSIEVGEPIFAAKISGSGQRATLSSIVDENKRAMTIRVNDVVGVAGFVLPGDRVDILLTRQTGDVFITDILLQSIHVLGIDQLANDRADEAVVAKAVTVEVDPVESQKLTLAAQVGTLSLALRSEADTKSVATQTIGIGDLQGGGAPAVIVDRPITRPIVRARSGDDGAAKVKIIRSLQSRSYSVRRENDNGGPPTGVEPEDMDQEPEAAPQTVTPDKKADATPAVLRHSA
jgi:pilus assembly protein CpaB